jgi:class 3 adenylate cyclase
MTFARRLATILAIDVVDHSHLLRADDESSLILSATRRLVGDGAGYTGLIRTGGEGMLERLQTHRQQLVEPKIAEYHGQILKTTGDGMLVEFASPVEAVRCAVEIQRAMIERNADTPTAKRVTLRIGIDFGETSAAGDLRDDGSAGTVARLERLAEPGGICISHAVRDFIRDKLPYSFEDIGERCPKNGVVTVHVYAMSADAVASAPDGTELPRTASARRRINLRSAAIAASVVATTGIWAAGGCGSVEIHHRHPPLCSLPPVRKSPRQIALPATMVTKDRWNRLCRSSSSPLRTYRTIRPKNISQMASPKT